MRRHRLPPLLSSLNVKATLKSLPMWTHLKLGLVSSFHLIYGFTLALSFKWTLIDWFLNSALYVRPFCARINALLINSLKHYSLDTEWNDYYAASKPFYENDAKLLVNRTVILLSCVYEMQVGVEKEIFFSLSLSLCTSAVAKLCDPCPCRKRFPEHSVPLSYSFWITESFFHHFSPEHPALGTRWMKHVPSNSPFHLDGRSQFYLSPLKRSTDYNLLGLGEEKMQQLTVYWYATSPLASGGLSEFTSQ